MAEKYTKNLKILKVNPDDQFADEAFNKVVDDIDKKVVGIGHLDSAMHWEEWKKETDYVIGDIIRYKGLSGGQYVKCIKAGTSDSEPPTNNITGSEVQDGTAEWLVLSLSNIGSDTTITLWKGNTYYENFSVVQYDKVLYKSTSAHTSAATFVLDSDKWVEIKASIRLWTNNIFYDVDDVVVNDKIIYKCITKHTSATTFTTAEKLNWVQIGGGSISNWTADEDYTVGQIVLYNNTLYKCKTAHKSVVFINETDKWDRINAGLAEWKSILFYPKDTIVVHNDTLYISKENHVSTNDFDPDEWTMLGSSVCADWAENITYKKDSLVLYHGMIYRCKTAHKSATEFDSTKWDITYSNISLWATETKYPVGSVVIRSNEIYRCKVLHTSADFTEDAETKWDKIGAGGAITIWAKDIAYDINQPVRYNDRIYICNTKHTSTAFEADKSKWDITYSNINSWATKIYYHIGATVEKDGVIYKCKTAHTSNVFADDIDNWVVLSASSLKDWESVKDYSVDDIVLFKNVMYRCKTKHKSSAAFNTDESKWNLIYNNIRLWDIDTPYKNTEVVVQNGRLLICKEAHVSSHTDIKYDIDKWELIGVTPDWISEMPYFKWQIIINDRKLYRVKEDFADKDFPENKVELISGVGGIVEWEEKTKYIEGQLIRHDKIVYKVLTDFTSGEEFNINQGTTTVLEQITMGYTAYWKKDTYYCVGETVVNGSSIIRCLDAHTSNETYNTEEELKWEIIASAKAIMSYWEPDIDYIAGNMVIYEDTMYICNEAHKSSDKFIHDMQVGAEKWRTVNTSNTIGEWQQVTKLDAEANTIVEIVINKTYTFLAPPVEILKFESGELGVTINKFDFNVADEDMFKISGAPAKESPFVEFGNSKHPDDTDDGTMHLLTKFSMPQDSVEELKIDGKSDGYIVKFKPIDMKEDFKSVSGYEVTTNG